MTAARAERAEDLAGTEDDDLTAVAPALLARLGGAGVMVAGLLTALLGLQLFLSVRGGGLYTIVPWTMLAVGLGSIPLGWQVNRARIWAAQLAIGLGAALSVGHLLWILVSFGSGIYSLLALAAVAATISGTALTLAALPACRRASDARSRLRDLGMDVGI